jgi:hypothetical protein
MLEPQEIVATSRRSKAVEIGCLRVSQSETSHTGVLGLVPTLSTWRGKMEAEIQPIVAEHY